MKRFLFPALLLFLFIKPYYKAYPTPPEERHGTPYWVTFKDGAAIKILQQYTP